MPSPDSVLITRPAGQEKALRTELEREGFRVCHQPLLQLEGLEEPNDRQRRLILALDGFQHVIFVSANAVRFGLPWLQRSWPRLPAELTWFAVGEATAELLRRQGLSVLTPGRQMSSDGLLALPQLQSVAGQRVLIVKGEGGRQELARVLAGRGAQVETLSCYRRHPPSVPAGHLAQLLLAEDVGVVVISSGEGLGNFLALLSPGESSKLRDVALLVPSARVAEQARRAGWHRLVLADNASDGEVLKALRRWRGAQGESV